MRYNDGCCASEPERGRQDLQGLQGGDRLMENPCCEERPQQEEVEYPIRGINIEPLNYGFIVRVGCQSFAIETPDKLIEKLTGYLKDPKKTETKWQREHIL
jgi:hypothetical protein